MLYSPESGINENAEENYRFLRPVKPSVKIRCVIERVGRVGRVSVSGMDDSHRRCFLLAATFACLSLAELFYPIRVCVFGVWLECTLRHQISSERPERFAVRL